MDEFPKQEAKEMEPERGIDQKEQPETVTGQQTHPNPITPPVPPNYN